MDEPQRPRADDAEAPPPLLGSWRNLYWLLLGELALLIALFRLLGEWAS